ncbi:MAG: hypothetical protein EB060_08665 [Proteobacteria bacterium]|nr:hypothetical protein [Pseudomonadota bacterium]
MEVIVRDIDLLNCGTVPTTANGGRFSAAIVGAAPPTVSYVNGSGFGLGAVQLALTSASQAQVACFHQADVLGINIDQLIRAEFLARCTVAPDAAPVKASFGLASARNDDVDAIAHSLLFNLTGSAVVNAQCDDNVVDTANVSSGVTLGTAWKRFVIDLGSADPGFTGKQDVRFLLDGTDGRLTEVLRASNAKFSVENSTSQLQIFAQVEKASGTGVGTIQLGGIRLYLRTALSS